MGDSDEEYGDSRRREKFRRERSDYVSDAPAVRVTRPPRREDWPERDWNRGGPGPRRDYRDYPPRNMDRPRGYSPGRALDGPPGSPPPPAKRPRSLTVVSEDSILVFQVTVGTAVIPELEENPEGLVALISLHTAATPRFLHDDVNLHHDEIGGSHPPLPALPPSAISIIPPMEVDYPTQSAMMSFKAFLATQSDDISDDDAIKKYNDYKLEFRRQQINDFFLAHMEEEWCVLRFALS
ncbi:unnamed protein product [Notodromas monacha]|uniref:SERRATE/Ars2 N-terminal domain-containing protein n=1 Tax=Notodromas monacha TaxID=399045 RepID=A0A7R9BMG9_9CRUS|nr:unnamed protein product [Notodromas monacha]CAG0918224.1 unnamed protein product [Notodromas monacha]